MIYENGSKRYNDEIFQFAGHNGAILLENGGGKTVFIQAALQAVLPHLELGERKVKETFLLEGEAAHIAIEWILNDKPRRYALTAVTLYIQNNTLSSYKYTYEYGPEDKQAIEKIPFVQKGQDGMLRPAGKAEIADYYQMMDRDYMNANLFRTTKDFHAHLEEHFKIVPDEWRSIALINGEEGGVDAFFDGCKMTSHLVENLLIPVVEQALAGKGSADFAKTFESQREHFKKHKQLSESIEDSKKIKQKIEEYVKKYTSYDEKIKGYATQKSEAKALWEALATENERLTQEHLTAKQGQEQCLEEKKTLDKLQRLCDLTDAQSVFKKAQTFYLDLEDKFIQQKQKKNQKEERLLALKVARLKKSIEASEAAIRVLQEKLDLLEVNQETDELKEALQENAASIKGYYQEELEALAKNQKIFENQKEKYNEECLVLQQELIKQEAHYLKLQKDSSKLEEKISSAEHTMNKIKKEILANPQNEDIEQESSKWQQRIAKLEEELVNIYNDLKSLEEERLSLLISLKANRVRHQEVLKHETKLEQGVKQIQELQDQLVEEVKGMVPALYSLSVLYTKSQQVITTLEEGVEKFAREKEEILLTERKLSRFLESYEDHEYFTADPLVETWTEKWRGDFSFLETGTQFIQRQVKEGHKDEADYYTAYPRWAQLIVIADGKETVIKNRVYEHRDKLTCPIGIISLSAAKAILQGDIAQDTLIYPSLWEENLNDTYFKQHKKEAKKHLEYAINQRKQKEVNLRNYEQLLIRVKDFLTRYPHENYLSLRTQKEALVQERINLERNIENQDERQEQIQREKDKKNEQQKLQTQEKNKLEAKVEKAQEYAICKQNVLTDKKELSHLSGGLEAAAKLIQRYTQDIKRLEGLVQDLIRELGQFQMRYSRTIEEPLYKAVKEEKAIYSDQTIDYLRDRRDMLIGVLNKKQESRSQIVKDIQSAQKQKDQDIKSMTIELGAVSYQVEVISFTEESEAEIASLMSERNKLTQHVEELQNQVNKARTAFDKAMQSYDDKKEKFEDDYKTWEKLDTSTSLVREEIKEKAKKLKEKENYLLQREQQLKEALKKLNTHQTTLKVKDETHKYLEDSVKSAILSQEILEALSYDLEHTIKQMIDTLTTLKDNKENSQKEVYEERQRFKKFCEEEIGDAKLKNMAIQGITQKESYEEILTWQGNMISRINTTLTILENDMAEKDKQIAQFIIHLYAYLKKIAQELGEIPKKTRVKLEEGWKRIYEFDIPDWQEEEGKAKIRAYIYTLLEELDQKNFINEQGQEDLQKVKKYIKDQFKIKQLMKVVMGNDAIRVKCRKVSSIGSISQQKFPWETSTKWSGGEKWSKNMALFLGILNYLAEKRQNIHTTGFKISRAVILDNPFGKASSEHVLEPVFFIAEQLGFQIIALTAHTEGDFIRNYFPIVYSCRLRLAADRSTSIFSKQQEIKKAFFMDHDPTALTTLSEAKQISLF